MLFVTVEDFGGKTELLVFPKKLSEDPDFWEEGKIVLVSGKVSTKDGSIKILLDAFEEFSSVTANIYRDDINKNKDKENEYTVIKLNSNVSKNTLNYVKRIFMRNEGGDQVVLDIVNDGVSRKIKVPMKVKLDDELKNDLKVVLGYEPEYSKLIMDK